MSEFASYDPGTPSWVDLATTDPAGAKAFYPALFGWSVEDMTTGSGVYTMFLLRSKPVAAAHELGDESRPPQWMTYITVEDVDVAAGRAAEAGGAVAQQPYDVGDSGRMALIVDPTGASFALWQPRSHVGSAFANEPGSFTWNELQTYHTGAAEAFYRMLFGWTAQTSDMPGGPYTSFLVGDHPVAGMMAIREEWGPVPPNWSVYFSVEDCDASCAKAEQLGGHVEMAPMDVAGVGRFALIADPQGAYFYVLSGMTG